MTFCCQPEVQGQAEHGWDDEGFCKVSSPASSDTARCNSAGAATKLPFLPGHKRPLLTQPLADLG